MARRNPHEDRWAEIVVDAATAWGHVGRSFHDRKQHVVTFVGLGDVPLDDPEGRIARCDMDEQRNEMVRRCRRLLASHYRAPAEWITGDAELDGAIRRELISVRSHPTSARAHAGVARFGRQLGIEGWQERWRWAADRYVTEGLELRRSYVVVDGVLMWIEIGELDRAGPAADLMLRGWDPDGPDVDLLAVRDTELNDLVLARWWRDGRSGLAAVVDRRPNFDGNTRVEAFALAAVAAETGLVDELREQVARLEQMHRNSEREIGPHAIHDGHEIRYVVEVARSWLAELDPPSDADQPPSDDVATVATASVRSSDVTAAPGATTLEWRGDTLVADGPAGAVGIGTEGHRALPPPGQTEVTPSSDTIRRDDDALALDRGDGSSIPLRFDWDEDQLENGEYSEVTWAPAGRRFAVWGEYGPIVVFGADGSPAGVFHDHWKGPNYGVEMTDGRMMSWARDGRAVVYDLDRRVVVGAVQMDGWPENAALHAGGRIVLTNDNVAHWLAHDIDTGVRLGPTRPAVRAAAHPTRPLVGFADATGVWVEEYALDG